MYDGFVERLYNEIPSNGETSDEKKIITATVTALELRNSNRFVVYKYINYIWI